MIEVKVTVEVQELDEALGLLEQCLPDGFVYDDANPGTLEVSAYAQSLNLVEEIDARVRATFPDVSIEHAAVADGWEDEWKKFHKPVNVGNLWIGPPWEQAPAESKAIVIDPGQGFGTGSHPTTWLCLSFLKDHQPDRIARAHDSLLDIGCGSGILAIAARKLGFQPVIAFDNDAVAVGNARTNVGLNGVSLDLSVRDGLTYDFPKTDVTVANILLEPLRQLAPRMKSDIAIVSGLLKSQYESANAAYEEVGYRLRERRDRDGWIALRFER